MEEEARVEISFENRFKEALRKAKEVREYIKERNDTRELDVAEWLAYDMRYVEEYVKQLEEENKELDYKNAHEYRTACKERDKYWKLKVKEKIRELTKEADDETSKDYDEIDYNKVNELLTKREVCKELLGRKINMYICLEKNESGDNALYYLKDIGRRRIYRQTYPVPQYKGLRLFTYKNKKNAQKICDYTNEVFGSNYQAVELGG